LTKAKPLHFSPPQAYARNVFRRTFALSVTISLLVQLLGSATANATVTWYQKSKLDVAYDGTLYNSQYDLEYSSVYIFDNSDDDIYFYLEFLQVPRVSMFNDGLGSFGLISLDYDRDEKEDFRLSTPSGVNLRTDRGSVAGRAYRYVNGSGTASSCSVGVFTNIDEGDDWVGFKVSRKCIGLPNSFNMFGYVEYNGNKNVGSFDYAPYPDLTVTLPSSSSSATTGSSSTSSGSVYALPSTKSNGSTSASNYSDAPSDLSKLSESLLPSVVTVKCQNGSGTGWSADSELSDALKGAGFTSVLLTNHHVIEDCLTNKIVSVVLSNGATVSGSIFAWNEVSDIAGIATKTSIPPLQWIGSRPKQGWWVGVLGSPLGAAGILTTGIVSSVNNITNTFTFTAAINPGNSGGPVFDSTGRVLGLATSKNLISSNTIAEGFGNAQGTPLLCSRVITCVVEKDPWGATSKYKAAASTQELTAIAEAKAAAEAAAKIAQDKAVAEAKAAAEAAAKIAQDKAVAEAKAAAEAAAKIASDALAKSQSDFVSLSANYNSTLNKLNEAQTQIEFLQGVIKNLQTQVSDLMKPKAETIVCKKGTLLKIVKQINPKCPKGYAQK
jgi:hypothetical protein